MPITPTPGSIMYRVEPDIIEILLKNSYGKKVIIKDKADDEGGRYIVTILGISFEVEDPDPAADSSAAIATDLEGQVNAEDNIRIEAETNGNELLLFPEIRGQDWSLEVETTDDGGSITTTNNYPETFNFYSAFNWDEPFTLLEEVSRSKGFKSQNARFNPTFNSMQIKDKYTLVRFTPADEGFREDDVLFFESQPVFDGVEREDDTTIAIVMGHTFYKEDQPPLILSGDAPVSDDVYDALTFHLPLTTSSFEFDNHGPNDVFLSFGRGPGEVRVPAGSSWANNSIGTRFLSFRTEAGAQEPSEVNAVAILQTLHN